MKDRDATLSHIDLVLLALFRIHIIHSDAIIHLICDYISCLIYCDVLNEIDKPKGKQFIHAEASIHKRSLEVPTLNTARKPDCERIRPALLDDIYHLLLTYYCSGNRLHPSMSEEISGASNSKLQPSPQASVSRK